MKWFSQILATVLVALPGAALGQSVVTYHNSPDRSGHYIVPGLTLSAAPKMHRDASFNATVSGNVYAQPLYWQAPGESTGILIVATESNLVYALNATTGAVVWQTKLAPPAPLSALSCGNIDPEGVTGTPVIDPATGTLYLGAMTLIGGQARQKIYALSASTGKRRAHWPLDVETAMQARKAPFESTIQGERSALQFFKGKLYVNYGGRYGDCGQYHGTVIEVTPPMAPSAAPSITGSWQTRSPGGGIWAQGGVATDGTGLFATTGNTFSPSTWEDGEAVVRLFPGLARPKPKDYFAPSNWLTLDNEDRDLGGTEALPFTVPTDAGGTAQRVLALGKDGNAYLLNGANLGGIGHPLQVLQVSNSVIITEPAIYNAKANTLIAFTNYNGSQPNCSGNNLTMLRVTADTSSPLSIAWCGDLNGGGSPIITTTDGTHSPIAWVVGADGDNKLYGFNALTGKTLFTSPLSMTGVHHMGTLIAANRHLYIAADGRIYAFAF